MPTVGPPACSDDLIRFGAHLADLASAAIRPYFRREFTLEAKADTSPVTAADRAAEAVMRRAIEASYPYHGIHGEEYGTARPEAPYRWILDPIDGTKSFVAGLPIFGTLIALTFEGRPLLGLIDQPITFDRWVGAAGHVTTLNGRKTAAAAKAVLKEAVIATTSVGLFEPGEDQAFEKLKKACWINRLAGDCIAYGLLASGSMDIVVESRVQPYDYAALIPVVQGAGGVITDWEGESLDTRSPARILAAANPALHEAARTILGGG